MKKLHHLRDMFFELGVTSLTPGFCDSAAFMAAENHNPLLLENYADYVALQDYTPEYIARAKSLIDSAAGYLNAALRAEGAMRACVDASLTFAKFLERQGIWCYVVKGATSIVFDSSLRLPSQTFSPIGVHENPSVAGHVWIVAPPYAIADITIRLQPYRNGQDRYLPNCVLAEAADTLDTFDATAMFDSEATEAFALEFRREPTHDDLRRIAPGLHDRAHRFGIKRVKLPHCQVTYIPCGICSMDGPFEQAANLILGGHRPFELYNEWIKSFERTS